MIPLIHPWTDWQEDYIDSNNEFTWRWKENTPKEIIKQYEEWEEYYNKKRKLNNGTY